MSSRAKKLNHRAQGDQCKGWDQRTRGEDEAGVEQQREGKITSERRATNINAYQYIHAREGTHVRGAKRVSTSSTVVEQRCGCGAVLQGNKHSNAREQALICDGIGLRVRAGRPGQERKDGKERWRGAHLQMKSSTPAYTRTRTPPSSRGLTLPPPPSGAQRSRDETPHDLMSSCY